MAAAIPRCCSLTQHSSWTATLEVCGPKSSTDIVFHNMSLGKVFVRKSAMFSKLGMYLKLMSSASAYSLTKWWCISMCFVRWWFLSFELMEIAPLLLAWIVIDHDTGNPTSSKYLSSHKACVVAHEKAINSASTVDRATVSCLFVSQETGPPATMKMLPSVDRHVFLHLAKSESTYPTGLKGAPVRYLNP